MLRIDQIASVRRLLAARHSHRAVRRRTGVSRSAIARIAARCRGPLGNDASELVALLSRCPACGHRVVLPCRICVARAWRCTTVGRPFPPVVDEPADLCLGLELRGEHLARYEALRRKRLRTERLSEGSGGHERRAS
jgi:hypothetical protein